MVADRAQALSDKVAIVTGGSRGIGLAIAQACADAGARVVLVGRDAVKLKAAEATRPGAFTSHPGDATDETCAEACVRDALAREGRLDILINNAGGNLGFGPLLDSKFEDTWRFNVAGPFAWCRSAWRAAMRERGGVILNIASIGGITVPRAMGAYSVAKAALIQMTRVLAAELSPGVRVNAIAPGLTRSDATEHLASREDLIHSLTPLGRIGEPVDIAAAARLLVSDEASWITGATLVIDGGALVETGRLQRDQEER